jgi:hypothetical protein
MLPYIDHILFGVVKAKRDLKVNGLFALADL